MNSFSVLVKVVLNVNFDSAFFEKFCAAEFEHRIDTLKVIQINRILL